jgi:c-di-GMP-related signal transduction protein
MIEQASLATMDYAHLTGALRYIARQPILDARSRVHGYELLFRSAPEGGFCGDGELATRTMIDNTVLFGLEKLSGGMPAFVNCTAEILTGQQVSILPPSMTVLEVLESVEPMPRLLAACRELKMLGFRLALDDFVWNPSLEPLIRLADYIKIDFAACSQADRREALAHLRGRPLALIAEKVEIREEFEQARAEGFVLFQGYYFCRPILLANRKVPANKLRHFEMLRVLHEDPLNLGKLNEFVKRDASLTFRLLRLVNSPLSAIRQEITSIKSALLAVGDDMFRRIATLAIASELNAGEPVEILRVAFTRARFCELAAELCARDASEQYLLGMFSMVPAMLHTSMSEIAPHLPLREEIRDALLGTPDDERLLLEWLAANEHQDFLHCDTIAQSLGLRPYCLQQCLNDAMLWADLTLSTAY